MRSRDWDSNVMFEELYFIIGIFLGWDLGYVYCGLEMWLKVYMFIFLFKVEVKVFYCIIWLYNKKFVIE